MPRRILPPDVIKTLQNVRLWFEVSDCTGATYHADADWLSDHGMNPDKVGGIQISADIVTSSDDQPGVILHELAHAFEEAQVLGPGRTELKSAYQAARLSGRYESVPRRGGGKERAYALTDVHEYFAELSEAYFSENDFYPFNRDDLEYFDPQGFAVIESLWKVAK